MALILPVIPAALAFAKLERTLSSNPTAAHAAATDKVCPTLLMSFIPVRCMQVLSRAPSAMGRKLSRALSTHGGPHLISLASSLWLHLHCRYYLLGPHPTLPLLSSWLSPYIAVTISYLCPTSHLCPSSYLWVSSYLYYRSSGCWFRSRRKQGLGV